MISASKLKSKKLIIITGPTGSGKTDLSIDVAKHFGTEIINCDSRQVYKELGVAVAKPSEEDLEAITHHFVSSHSIHEKPISAGAFARLALEKLKLIFKEKDVVVLCGGTGFYISALLYGFTVSDGKDKEIHRNYVDKLYAAEGLPALINELIKRDPDGLEKLDQHNTARVKRALELCLSKQKSKIPNEYSFPYSYQLFVLTPERHVLYDRINRRVDAMVNNGLEAEAQELHGFLPEGIKTVGYSEIFDYFDGTVSKEEAIAKVKQHSRNYAKRQLTYARHQFKEAIWLEPNTAKDTIFARN
ncbi:tRNA (adenosine(37)-N6)-dimethylallyltransferase MiaA [Bacteroidia bacterium]|jgi:tRNA dimethylallyltransferase|nr:tRNA (adenosine(37)-N6)-dimethylallyltransferase MiaA [Bacteroidia bacterium]